MAHGLQTLCEGVEEAASPLEVFLKARKLFRTEGVSVAFLPSYSPARFFALFAAAKSLGIRTVMMNESHAGTEQATGWRRWIKRQIVKRFDAAFVGGEPHKRHFASLGIPAEKIFTGYDAVDSDFFASRADEIRAAEKKSDVWRVTSDELGKQEDKADEVRKKSDEWREPESVEMALGQTSDELGKRLGAAHLSTLISQPSTEQSLRSAYGLPERYFLSLGRMVEKKNLSTLVEAYARFARASGEKSKAETGNLKPELSETDDGVDAAATKAENCKLNTEHCAPALVFVGSGELEGALREQARSLGLRVVERTDWKAGRKRHETTGLQDHETKRPRDKEPSLRDGARRSRGQTKRRKDQETEDCKLTADASAENDRGAVYFYGFRQIEENPVFYALAEAFVLPSLKEEWGLVVNEAMACSLPVIVSRTAGCAEDLLPGSESWQCSVGSIQSGGEKKSDDCKLITGDSLEERSNGFVFDPKSCDALSEALCRIEDHGTTGQQDYGTSRLAEMGRRSREIVAKFSCENFARQALRAAEATGAL